MICSIKVRPQSGVSAIREKKVFIPSALGEHSKKDIFI